MATRMSSKKPAKTSGRGAADTRKDIKDHIDVVIGNTENEEVISALVDLKQFIDGMAKRDARRLGGRGRK